MALAGARVICHLTRTFSCSCASSGKELQGRFLLKLLSNKLDRKLQKTSTASHAAKLLDNKRTAVLGKFYMENISQALAFGGFKGISERGIQVTRVSVKNAGTVEVYWLANENENHIEIQNMLTNLAGQVASKLMYANTMGYVPRIVFKRDLGSLYIAETEKRLRQVAQENEIHQNLTDHERTEVPEVSQEMKEFDCPTMRMDVFGLPHDKIFKRIYLSRKNFHLCKVPAPPSTEELFQTFSSDTTSESCLKDSQVRQRELKKFIAAFKKSPLSSSAPRCKDTKQRDTVNYYDDDYDDEDDEECYEHQYDLTEENWEETDTK